TMASKKKIVVTGFEPFAEHTVNSSWVAVQLDHDPELNKCKKLRLVIHIAQSCGLKGLSLCAHCCVENGPDCIKSILDMDTICKRVNDAGIGITVSTSEDAGRYLCDYTYYTSLHLGKGRAAFVHVPPLAKPYSGKDLGRALQAVIQEMLKLLEGILLQCVHNKNQ
uniref:Pyroglutamyl-peptidase I n=1 Tax=Haplochromis burtoni TaxID=8153 RepID=A0A3Q2VLD4_HAPBU